MQPNPAQFQLVSLPSRYNTKQALIQKKYTMEGGGGGWVGGYLYTNLLKFYWTMGSDWQAMIDLFPLVSCTNKQV